MSTGSRILLADDEADCSRSLAEILTRDGHRVTVTPDGSRARQELLSQDDLGLVIAELAVPEVDGFELLRVAHQARPGLPVILMSEFGSVETAVAALRRGAFHYFQKPLDMQAVRATVKEALVAPPPSQSAAPPPSRPRRAAPVTVDQLGIVGQGPWYEHALSLVRRVAPTRATVLVTGESGTGKELFARAIHKLSGRSGPFVAVSCAALPRDLLESELFGHEKGAFTGAERQRLGRFELAHGGTLLLDEIGEVPPDLQVKLLRVIQEREFERIGGTETVKIDVRIVAATNRDLDAAVAAKQFREDLLYRLKVVEIALPPLRERPDDIDLLARHFISRYAEANGRDLMEVPSAVLQAMRAYAWPGNTRELENCIERAVVLADPDATEVELHLLPDAVARAASGSSGHPSGRPAGGAVGRRVPLHQLEESERVQALLEALAAVDGNAAAAARALGVTPRSVRYYADRYNLPRQSR
ncbi:MAG: sigma-54-dependent transcriptional regulator [Armatimonadota bacterium]